MFQHAPKAPEERLLDVIETSFFITRPSLRRPHYALHPGHPLCPSVLSPQFNSKTENHTMFKLRGKVIHARSNWQRYEVKRSKIKVTGAEKGKPAYHVVHWGRTYFLNSAT